MRRKRWIAYRATTSASNQFTLWLVDPENLTARVNLLPDLTSTPSANTVDSFTTDVERGYSFSPEGKWFAFVADEEVDQVFGLHVVDASGKTIGETRRISSDSMSLDSYNWSPSGDRIAWMERNSGSDQMSVLIADLTKDPIEPVKVADGVAYDPVAGKVWFAKNGVWLRDRGPGGLAGGAADPLGASSR